MKAFKSIKWRLQIWYGLILVAVLAGLGFAAYQLERNRLFDGVDRELTRRAGILADSLHARGGPRPNDQPFDRPPPDQQPRDFPDEQNGPLRNEPPPRTFHLPAQQAGLFNESDKNDFYYAMWTRDGRALASSTNTPSDLTMPVQRRHSGGPNPPQSHGRRREVLLVTPPGEMVLVGHDMQRDLAELRTIAWTLTLVGAGILLVGLAGGWWLAARAIRPIKDISATAAKIASGDLSQRINVGETESELGELAAVLNSTFARLESAFAQQKQFASDAAHELRTPVTVMLTQTQTALNRERSAAEYKQAVEACQRAAKRMRRLIESLLQLTRLDAGQEKMKRMRFDVAHVAQDCVDLVQPMADERQLTLNCDVPALEISGDPERISQVITNLLTNAIQYNHPGGEVRIRGNSQNGTAILRVTNTGDGIPARDLPHVFERFYRADKSRSSANAGLGLAISKAIVEAHGGTIEAASDPESGTTFTIRLPVTP